MTTEDEGTPDGEHTFPPDRPIPADALGRYTLGHDLHEEAEIADYVNGQCRGDETVRYVERIKTEYVSGVRYDAWDVHTDKQRWWVLTNLTNLYAQSQFPSLDYTLSFHIGLMHRIQEGEGRERDSDSDPFEEVYRRRDEVADLIVQAIEAEEFQSAAMRLRECLITLVRAVRQRIELSASGDTPKDADVPGWNELLINHFCPGESNKTLRQYLKATADRTWQLVNWLTHDRDANKTEAIIAHEAVGVQIGHFIQLVIRDRVDLVVQCPQCSSRDVRSYYDSEIRPDGAHYQRCRACDWCDHPGYSD
ncbi:MAG TPA: hypothetical protein VF449_08015 [Parvibaculum sp.]